MSTPSKDRESQKSSNFHPTVADAMDNIGDSAKKNYFSLFPEELIVSMLDENCNDTTESSSHRTIFRLATDLRKNNFTFRNYKKAPFYSFACDCLLSSKPLCIRGLSLIIPIVQRSI